jgi:purine-binding chemotaxis protein CheW
MSELQYVVFFLGQEEYGIHILHTQEINRLKDLKMNKVPNAPSFIQGLINLRGEIVPILNLRQRFELPPQQTDKKTRVIIAKSENKIFGLLVDRVSHVLQLDEINISIPPEEIRYNTDYITGLGKKDKRTIFLLDVNKLA